MTDVVIPFSNKDSDNAVLLLAAAEELGLGQQAVKTSEGGFVVPTEVAERAGLVDKPKPKRTTKKAAAKKKVE